jgi:23S rRNA (guanine2445-N2)-methyltransferase / 23S rRNA (guanine2069-N7)-methyltransferase
VQSIDWSEHLRFDDDLWIDFVGTSRSIRTDLFGAQRTKDAIVDQLRTPSGARPGVDRRSPDVTIHVHLRNSVATVSIDLSGPALYARTPGREVGNAPLKETLAATILHLAGWPDRMRTGAPLVDPMCGSGTFILEAAGMALDRAPGLSRQRWGFGSWRGHEHSTWKAIVAEANERAEAAPPIEGLIVGYDSDARAVRAAQKNQQVLKLTGPVFKARPLKDLHPEGGQPGLLVTNPPYGERLEHTEELQALHGHLGDMLRQRMLGWDAFVFTRAGVLSKSVGLKTERRHILHNGPLECRLLQFAIANEPPQRFQTAVND